jgi:hypothetical protein
MTQLDKLELKLDEALNKKAPVKLPDSSRKTLADSMWWLALIGGLFQLYWAWWLWDKWHVVDRAVDVLNSYAAAFGVRQTDAGLGFSFYLVLVTLLVSGALLLLAAPGLKAKKKTGWNLVFYSLLVNLVYGVIVMFTDYGGFSNLLGALIGSVIGAFLLFQVREYFMKSSTAGHHKS